MNNFRPLSPHITVHKWILSQIMSILHRATAIGFSIGSIFVSVWLLSLSLGPEYYLLFQSIFFNIFGKIIITIILFCFFFYFFDEFRKLFWVFGYGLNINTLRITSYLVFFSSIGILFFIL